MKNKICKYRASIPNNGYMDKLQTYDSTVKMNPVDVTYCKCIEFGMKIVRTFSEKKFQKTYQTEVSNHISNVKATIVLLTVGLIKKISLHKISYLPEPHTCGEKVKVELDVANYATKSDLKVQQVSIL